MKTLKEKDKQSFLARKEEVYSLIMEMGSLLADYDHQWSNELRRKFENRCSACVEIMANDDNGVSMMHYIDYEDIIGVELIKN